MGLFVLDLVEIEGNRTQFDSRLRRPVIWRQCRPLIGVRVAEPYAIPRGWRRIKLEGNRTQSIAGGRAALSSALAQRSRMPTHEGGGGRTLSSRHLAAVPLPNIGDCAAKSYAIPRGGRWMDEVSRGRPLVAPTSLFLPSPTVISIKPPHPGILTPQIHL